MITHYIREENCCYCLQAFRTAETLKCHIKDSFKINRKKKRLKCQKRVNMLDSKTTKEN